MKLFVYFSFLVALVLPNLAQICLDPSAILVDDQSKCLISIETLPNIEAIKTCAIKGGELSIINNNRELKPIIRALIKFGYYGIWINAHKADNGLYTWENGRPFPGSLGWCENSTKTEDCTVLLCSYGDNFSIKNCCFTDRECLTPFASLCVKNTILISTTTVSTESVYTTSIKIEFSFSTLTETMIPSTTRYIYRRYK